MLDMQIGFVANTQVIGITGKIFVDKQLSGLVKGAPKLKRFTLSTKLAKIKPQIKLKNNTRSIRYDIRWNENNPLSGKINLGQILIEIPNDVPLGSSFLVRCEGLLVTTEQGQESMHTEDFFISNRLVGGTSRLCAEPAPP